MMRTGAVMSRALTFKSLLMIRLFSSIEEMPTKKRTFSVKNHLQIKKQERNFLTSLNLMTAVIPPFSRESLDCLSQTVMRKFVLLFVFV